MLSFSYCPAGNLARHFLGDMLYWKMSRIFIILEDQVLFLGWHVTFYVAKTVSMTMFCTCKLSRLLIIAEIILIRVSHFQRRFYIHSRIFYVLKKETFLMFPNWRVSLMSFQGQHRTLQNRIKTFSFKI